MKRFFSVFCLTALFIYLAFALSIYQKQRALMYTPILEKLSRSDVGVQNVKIIHIETEDGLRLEGWYVPPQKENNKIIVFFHGNGQNIGSSYSGVAQLIKDGYGLLMVEYRGYAGHKGTFTEQGVYKDCRAFIDWLSQTHQVKYSDMILYGESLGAAVAVQMASEYDAHALILLAPFSSMVDIARARYPYLPVSLLLEDQYLSDKKIQQIRMPILIMHGNRDRVIDIESGGKLFEAANEPKKFVEFPQGGHNNLYDFGASQHVLNFLAGIDKKN